MCIGTAIQKGLSYKKGRLVTLECCLWSTLPSPLRFRHVGVEVPLAPAAVGLRVERTRAQAHPAEALHSFGTGSRWPRHRRLRQHLASPQHDVLFRPVDRPQQPSLGHLQAAVLDDMELL